jgi:isopenicillin N synthase-like dioxygenase
LIESAAWQAATEFFRLPLDDKLSVAIPPGDAYGYGPFQVERLAASLGEDTPPDLKETFSIGPGPQRCAESVTSDAAAAFVFSPSQWPAALPAMEAALRTYYDAMAVLVDRVMSLMALGLGLRPDYFARFIDRHTSALRSLHYPDLRRPDPRGPDLRGTDLRGTGVQPGQLRAGAHSDYGTLTLLRQDDAPGGLQVRDVAGDWHDVPAVEDAYVVNVGDALERWTNDRWRSTVHRVVVPPADAGRDCSRQSMAFFHNANWDAVIECLPTCVETGAAPRHAPITAGRHLMDKFLSTQS